MYQFGFKNAGIAFPYFCLQLLVDLISTRCAASLLERPDPIEQFVIILGRELGTARFYGLTSRTHGANGTDWRTDSIVFKIFQSTIAHGVLDVLKRKPISML